MATPSESALRYTNRVIAGEIPAGKYVRLACQRFIDDLNRAHKGWIYAYDQDTADYAVEWMERLPHVKGKWARHGQLLQLEDWQRFIECNLFGWLNIETGLRRFRESFELVPRKNGKSLKVAARGLYMFAEDREYGPEVYSGATSERQAWEIFRPAREMCKRTDWLREEYDIEVNAKNLVILSDGARFEPIIGKPGDGPSPSFAAVDEYHEHASDDQVDTLQTGMGAREQPLLSIISTAGVNLGGPCYEKQQDVVKILEGTVKDETVFAIIYGVDEEDQWDSVDSLVKANPNYGISVSPEFLKQQLDAARRSASKQNSFRTKHLNQWVGAKTSWMNMLAWQRQKKKMSIDEFSGESCHVAIDLAEQKDASSVAALFKRGEKFYLFVKHFVPEAAFEWNPKYKTFALGGHIEVTPGNAQDYGEIKKYIEWISDNFTCNSVTFDPWQANQMMQELLETGLDVYKFTQQFSSFSDPMKTVETAVLDKNFYHNGDPVLTWMVGNISAFKNKDDHIKPVKDNPNNPACKIDGGVAMIMAMKGYTMEEERGSLESWLSDPVVSS